MFFKAGDLLYLKLACDGRNVGVFSCIFGILHMATMAIMAIMATMAYSKALRMVALAS